MITDLIVKNTLNSLHTVSSEMFARTLFSQIFVNLLPSEFKILINKESLYAIKTTQTLVCEFKTLQIIQKKKFCEMKIMRKFPHLQYHC